METGKGGVRNRGTGGGKRRGGAGSGGREIQPWIRATGAVRGSDGVHVLMRTDSLPRPTTMAPESRSILRYPARCLPLRSRPKRAAREAADTVAIGRRGTRRRWRAGSRHGCQRTHGGAARRAGRWCPPGSRQWRAAAAPPSGPRRGPPRAAHAAARRRASRAAVSACPRQRGSRRSRWTEVCGGRPPLRLFGCRRRWCGVAWPPPRRVTCGRLPGVRPAGGSSGRRAQWQKQVDRDGGEQ